MISATHETPVGVLTLVSNGEALTRLDFENPRYPKPTPPRGDDRVLRETRRQLDAYFAGRLRAFDVPLAADGTPFQQQVWKALLDIGYGATWSYGRLAEAIGSPKASRAVGLANGRNPISIIVPCHRVIGANGSLTGYGGGMERKQILLDLERGQARLR